MNIVFVWVMLVQTSGGAWLPTLEFKTEQKCRVAADEVATMANKHKILGRPVTTPICLKIEK